MTDPLWLSVARMSMGITEHVGPGSNPVILQWARDIHAPGFADDDTAWCAVFLNRLLLACHLPMAGSGYDLLRARAFMSWGHAMPIVALGAVLVFSRDQGAHVGLYVGERADAYRVLGGNQANRVSETWMEKSRLIGIRWPVARQAPEVGPILLADNGQPLSPSEA